MVRPRRVLVTGGAGFVGSHVVDALVSDGIDVRVLDSLAEAAHDGKPPYLNDRAEYVFGDVRDTALVERCLAGCDAVSHQAAMVGLGTDLGDVADYVSVNDGGTASLVLAVHHAGFRGRLVLASSMVVYGEGAYRCTVHGPTPAPPRAEADLLAGRFEPRCPTCGRPLTPAAVTEDAPVDPRNVYAATKVHQEHLCAAAGREAGIPVTALRYHNVYGPRMPRDTPYSGVAAIFRSALERGEPPRIFEDGGQLRDFIHVEDVARANVLALSAAEPVAGAFNVATGQPRTVRSMADLLADAFGATTPRPVVTGRYRLGDVRHVFASPAKAERDLRFTARTGFEEGMRRFARDPLRGQAFFSGA
jgi:dTDP-L-rhamnose 4-epimerase